MVLVGVVTLDQVTKSMVTSRLTLGQSLEVIPDFLHLTLVRNSGMAFGLLSGSDVPYKTVLVTFLSLGALAAVVYYALLSTRSETLTRFGLAFILGGAVGNIIDRIRLGYVVDFVDVFYHDTHWPAFNVADSCICVGVGLLILDSFRRREDSRSAQADVARSAVREGS